MIPTRLHWWLFGVLTAAAVLGVMSRAPIVLPAAIAAVTVIAVRSPERAALGGGALVARPHDVRRLWAPAG